MKASNHITNYGTNDYSKLFPIKAYDVNAPKPKIINYEEEEEIISSLSFNIDPSKAEGDDIKEFLFPKSNLVDKKTFFDQFIKMIEPLSSAEEDPLTSTNNMNRPVSGNVSKAPNSCALYTNSAEARADEIDENYSTNVFQKQKLKKVKQKTMEIFIAPRAIIDRMYLITAASPVLEFKFSRIYDDNFMSLSSFKLIDEDQRVDEVANRSIGSDGLSHTLKISFNDMNNPFFDEVRMQCVYLKRDDGLYKKSICYLELISTYATAQLDGCGLKDQRWKLGTELIGDDLTSFKAKYQKHEVLKTETVYGPLMITGVGIDRYPGGFLFQISTFNTIQVRATREQLKSFADENTYEENARLQPASKSDYTPLMPPYPSDDVDLPRNFQELAIEDEESYLLFKKLDDFSRHTPNPISRVLPDMIMMVDRCLTEGRITLAQAIIRMNHMTFKDPSGTNKRIWATFKSTMSTVKQFIIKKPTLNMIECEIIGGTSLGKLVAILMACAQIFLIVILVIYVVFHQCNNSAIYKSCCFWKNGYAIPMSIMSFFFSIWIASSHIEDKLKFDDVFTRMIRDKKMHCMYYLINELLLFLDFISNKILPYVCSFVAFVLLGNSSELLDMVLNLLAITYIVELDQQLNPFDIEGINDLVRKYFKDHLKKKMDELSIELDREWNKDRNLFKDDLIKVKYDSEDLTTILIEKVITDNYHIFEVKSDDNDDLKEDLKEDKNNDTIQDKNNDANIVNDDIMMSNPQKLILTFKNNLSVEVLKKRLDVRVIAKILNKYKPTGEQGNDGNV